MLLHITIMWAASRIISRATVTVWSINGKAFEGAAGDLCGGGHEVPCAYCKTV